MTGRQLVLLRHGPAEDAKPGMRDFDRPLTDAGARETRDAVAGLASVVEPPTLILSSPLTRTRQTAELLAARFPAAEVVIDAAVAPGVSPEGLRQRLIALQDESLVVVGHEPDLSTFVAWQLGAAGGRVTMGKATAAVLDAAPAFAPGRASLRGLYSRRVLGRLGT